MLHIFAKMIVEHCSKKRFKAKNHNFQYAPKYVLANVFINIGNLY